MSKSRWLTGFAFTMAIWFAGACLASFAAGKVAELLWPAWAFEGFVRFIAGAIAASLYLDNVPMPWSFPVPKQGRAEPCVTVDQIPPNCGVQAEIKAEEGIARYRPVVEGVALSWSSWHELPEDGPVVLSWAQLIDETA